MLIHREVVLNRDIMPRKKVGPFDIDKVYHGDSLKLLKDVPDDTIDLVITDPPFAIDFKAKRMNYNRTGSRVLEGYSEVPAEEYLDFTRTWIKEAGRTLKDSGSMYVFSGWNNLKDILISLEEAGLELVNHIIWKYQFGVFTKRRFVSSHYHCLYVCKDDKKRKFHPYRRFGPDERTSDGGKAHYRDKEDVWDIKREYWKGKKKTPTKLPSELIRKILAYSSDEGDLVLDPFLGSGQVAVVSKEEGRHFLGFEIVEEYLDFARERL
jgi:site-specific DNA-methyltransferase (adenine-specific)